MRINNNNNNGLNLFPVIKVNTKVKRIIFAINDHHFKQIGFHLLKTRQKFDKMRAYAVVIVTEM